MPPTKSRKRRAAGDLISPEVSDHDDVTPRTQRSQGQAGNRRPRQVSSSDDDDDDDDDEDDAGDTTLGTDARSDIVAREQLVKKLVRLALASEYARQPIRRTDISAKVLGPHSRMYKYVFEEAQKELRRVFGMQMTELPMREKVTVSQRRAAQRTDRATTSSKVYALTSTLSDNYRVNEDIIVPPKVPTSESEATYVGLYTFVVSIISLCGGRITEEKLNRYLRRANAEPYTPVDKTDKLLQRFCKEGYLVKIKDSSNGEEQIEYTVGPRGKVEVGTDGVAGLVKTVYGDGTTEDLEARIQRSLGLDERPARRQQPNPPGEINTSSGRAINASTRTPGRPATRQTRSRRQAEEEAEEEEE